MALPGVGQVSYNGLVFDGPMVSSKVSIEAVRGDDDRAVIYNNITVEIHATIDIAKCGVSQATLDSDSTYLSKLDQVRSMLSQDGKALVFEDKIFRRFHVNTGPSDPDGVIDVNYGPRVKVGSIEPIASNKAFEVVWSVTAAVGQCPAFDGDSPTGGVAKSWEIGDIKQFVYGVAWSSDHRGYSSRTVSGFIEIVQAPELELVPGTISISADDYRERLTVHMPEGFRRVGNEWQMNEKKDRCQFVIRDEEIDSPNAFPPNVVDISVKHKTGVGLMSSGFCKAMNTLSCSCEVANPFDCTTAWERLFPIIAERILAARAESGAIMLLDVNITEELFARTVSAEIVYQILKTSPAGFIKSSGLFSKPTTTWDEWRATMYGPSETEQDASLPFSRRSVANLSFEPQDDVIVTPCTSQPFEVTVHNQRLVPFPNDLESVLSNSCPPPDKSYRRYESALESVVKGGAATFAEMPTEASSYTPESAATSDGTPLSSGVNADTQESRTADSTSVGPLLDFVLTGRGERLGYPVEIPTIAKDWGQAVKKVPNGSKIKSSSRMFLGCRLYFATWTIKYKIAQSLVDAAADLGDLQKTLFKTTSYPLGDQADVD